MIDDTVDIVIYNGFVTVVLADAFLLSPPILFRNLPLSIAIGMLITTFFYLLANLAYFAVLTPKEMLESTAVAVTFAEKSLGGFAVIMPLFVACSVFGAMNGQVIAW